MKTKLAIAALASLLVVAVSGCDDTKKLPVTVEKKVTLTAKAPLPTKTAKDVKPESLEFDCRLHSADKICAVPWKDKTVLYCYANKIPKVVRYRSECVR